MFLTFLLGMVFIVGLAAPLLGVTILGRYRTMRKTPLALARYLKPGPVSMSGKAVPFTRIAAPFSGKPCVYCEYNVYALSRSGSGKHAAVSWDPVLEAKTSGPFYLRDNSGQVLVATDPAWIDIPESFTLQNASVVSGAITRDLHRGVMASLHELGVAYTDAAGQWRPLRLTERCIEEGSDVFVWGHCGTMPEQVRTALGKMPENDEERAIRKAIVSGDTDKERLYIALGSGATVPRKLVLYALMCFTLGPLAALVSGLILYLAFTA